MKKRASEIAPPGPNSVRVHNDQEEWNAVTPGLQAADTSESARLLRNHVLGGATLPEHWYGGGGDVNRATGDSMGEPTFKVFSMRQRDIKHILEEIGRYVLRQEAIAAGNAEPDFGDANNAVEAVFPEMVAKDTTRYTTALQQVVAGCAQAVQNRFLSVGMTELQKEVDRILGELSRASGQVMSEAAGKAWAGGESQLTEPMDAAGFRIALPHLDTTQLMAMRTFMVDRIADISTVAASKIRQELGLVMIGAQPVHDTIGQVTEILGESSRLRATTIIRTELGRTWAVASHETALQTAQVGVPMDKVWRRSGKIHSRLTHDLADGQRVAVDKPLTVGTIKMRFPHDPSDRPHGPYQIDRPAHYFLIPKTPPPLLPHANDLQAASRFIPTHPAWSRIYLAGPLGFISSLFRPEIPILPVAKPGSLYSASFSPSLPTPARILTTAIRKPYNVPALSAFSVRSPHEPVFLLPAQAG